MAVFNCYVRLYDLYCTLIREAAKKVFFLMAGLLRGGGAKRVCHYGPGKKTFFNVRKKVPYFHNAAVLIETSREGHNAAVIL